MKILFPSKPKEIPPPPPQPEVEVAPEPLAPIVRRDMDIVIDVSWLSYRSAYAYYDLQYHGQRTGHVYGALMALMTLYKEYSAEFKLNFFFALDGEPVWRKQQFPDYKAGRVKTLGYDPRQDVISLFTLVPGTFLENPEEEADDLIAAYLKSSNRLDKQFVVVSADKDLWVLRDRFNAIILGNKLIKLEGEHVQASFFTGKSAFVSLAKAIIGDDGDNLPKVLRFPRKDLGCIFSAMLTPQVDEMLKVASELSVQGKITPRSYQLLLDNEKQIRSTFALASLREDVEVRKTTCIPNKAYLEEILTKFGCTSLIPRLETFFRGE